MSIMSMNSENTKTFNLYRPELKPTNNLDLQRDGKYVALSGLIIYYTCFHMLLYKKVTMNLKYQELYSMKNLNYRMDFIVYQIFKTTF